MHFNGDNSCVKRGSKLTYQIARFGGQSGVRIFRGQLAQSVNGGRSWLLDVCILLASFCRFLVGFRHSRVLNYIRNCR